MDDCFLLLEFLEFRKRSREEFDSLEAVVEVRLPDGPCEEIMSNTRTNKQNSRTVV